MRIIMFLIKICSNELLTSNNLIPKRDFKNMCEGILNDESQKPTRRLIITL